MATAIVQSIFPALLALGLLGTLPGPAPAVVGAATVQLRVFPHASVDVPTLQLARTKASKLLASGRISAEWLECGTPEHSCTESSGPVPSSLLLVPVAKTTEEDVSGCWRHFSWDISSASPLRTRWDTCLACHTHRLAS